MPYNSFINPTTNKAQPTTFNGGDNLKLNKMKKSNKQTKTNPCAMHGIVSSAEIPAVRVRNYNEETGETEDGTVIDETLNTYLVIPDFNLQMTVKWDKMNCDVLR